MSVSFDFTGKVALVTGSSSGIGAATAIMFAKSGARVVVTGRNQQNISEISKECEKVSPNRLKVLEVVADVTKEEDMKKLVETTIEEFGKIDILVNNAGSGNPITISDPNYMTAYRCVLETNLSSVVFMIHLCSEHLAKTKGNIVNISSVAAYMASETISPYSMSKSALDMLTKCMAIELGPLGIRVNNVNPGVVKPFIIERIGLSREESQTVFEAYGTRYPIGRYGLPEEISNAILFLASDASAFTTGTIMVVDGGHIAAGVRINALELI